VAGDGVVTSQGYERVTTYDAAEGGRRWSFAPPGANPRLAWSLGSAGDAVYVGVSNRASPSVDVDDPYDRVYAFDRQSGERLWHASLEPASEQEPWVVPEVVAAGDGLVVVATEYGTVLGLDAADGSERWRTTVDGSPRTPVVADDTVLQATSDGLFALDAATGRARWRARGERTPAVADGVVYCPADGVLGAFDLADGERRWAAEIPDGIGRAPTVADGRVYLPAAPVDGLGEVFAFDADTGCRHGRFTGVDGPTTPAASGDTLYVGGEEREGRLWAVSTP
jgi:outer membrane protein assembly factor BamB